MNNFDDFMTNVIGKEIYLPDNYTNSIKNAFKQKRKNNNINIIKLIAIISSFIIGMSGICYATIYIYNSFNNRKGISSAIEHGYIAKGSNKVAESNRIRISAEEFLLDDKNLNINFSIEFNQNIEDVKNIYFRNMIIYDEQNRVLFCNSEKLLNNFINTKKANISIGNFTTNYINSGLSIKARTIFNNRLTQSCNFTPYNCDYPESSKLYIEIEDLEIYSTNSYQLINGFWTLEESLPAKFQNREKYNYYLKDLNSDILDLNLSVYNTESDLKITLLANPEDNDSSKLTEFERILDEYYSGNNVEQYNSEEISEIEKAYSDELDRLYTTIKDLYVENSNGEKFYITNGVNLHGEVLRPYNENIVKYSDVLDLTTYKASQELVLHFIYKNTLYNLKLFRK